MKFKLLHTNQWCYLLMALYYERVLIKIREKLRFLITLILYSCFIYLFNFFLLYESKVRMKQTCFCSIFENGSDIWSYMLQPFVFLFDTCCVWILMNTEWRKNNSALFCSSFAIWIFKKPSFTRSMMVCFVSDLKKIFAREKKTNWGLGCFSFHLLFV